MTGEMQRHAVIKATARDVAAVRRCRECEILSLSLSLYLACTLKTRIIDALLCHSLTDAIMSAMMNFNLRNGNLRKKTDAIKVRFGVGFVVRDFGVSRGLKKTTINLSTR